MNRSLAIGLFWALVFVAVGVFMLVEPDLFDDGVASGRRALQRQVMRWAWGVPGAIVMFLLAAIAGLRAWKER